MVKLCPNCGSTLTEVGGGYMCRECGRGMFRDDEVITPKCPSCGEELSDLSGSFFCYSCSRSVSKDDALSGSSSIYDDYEVDEPDYDSMIGNGDEICLNCTYWSTSPYGASYGMVCRRGYPTDGPGDSCSGFVKSTHFVSYGDNGQYQFNETDRDISNKLYHWKHNR